MIRSVRNPAALVFKVSDEGELDEPQLQTFDNQMVGLRASDNSTVRQTGVVFRKRHRPVPRGPERYYSSASKHKPRSGSQGGQVIRPSVLKAMTELQELVDREFPER